MLLGGQMRRVGKIVADVERHPGVGFLQGAALHICLSNARMAQAALTSTVRKTPHATSGRKSSQRTTPPVACSISGHRSAGTSRMPLHHWLTAEGVTCSTRDIAVRPPTSSQALEISEVGVLMRIM